MRRLLAAIRCDMRLQLRNGFYYATAVITLLWVLAVLQLPPLDLSWLLPAMLLNDLVLGTFYFMGGVVLLEKSEGTLEALVVTPLRMGEYLASKVLTLSALALVQNLILVLALQGVPQQPLWIIAGIAAAAAILCLAGFAVVLRYSSINEYLLPSIGYVALLMIPLVYTAGWQHWLLYLHPLQAPLLLMRAAFAPLPAWQLGYALGASALWVALGYALCRRTFGRFVVARVGASA